jgi:hypothetical protein
MKFGVPALVLGLAASMAPACSQAEKSPYRLDNVLRLNDVQAKGTHNSYHLQADKPVDPSLFYTHAPLDIQLEEQGVRQFELDLHLHRDNGFEVFHLPGGIDSETTCRRFTNCLQIIKNWSDENRWHLPLVIWLEPKDEEMDSLYPELEPIVDRYDELEADILSVWPRMRILKPDDVRGVHATLPEAIAADGWPTLGELRGKVVFSMLDSGTHRQRYTQDAPNLAGKLMFVDSDDPADPYAAFFKVDDAQSDSDRVQELVNTGFIVTTNTDGPEKTPEENQARLEASLASGAHFLSTDFPVPVEGREYWFDLPPGGAPARCNPLTHAAGCTPADIESLP